MDMCVKLFWGYCWARSHGVSVSFDGSSVFCQANKRSDWNRNNNDVLAVWTQGSYGFLVARLAGYIAGYLRKWKVASFRGQVKTTTGLKTEEQRKSNRNCGHFLKQWYKKIIMRFLKLAGWAFEHTHCLIIRFRVVDHRGVVKVSIPHPTTWRNSRHWESASNSPRHGAACGR